VSFKATSRWSFYFKNPKNSEDCLLYSLPVVILFRLARKQSERAGGLKAALPAMICNPLNGVAAVRMVDEPADYFAKREER
jgi:hypothetical protein